jgi:hypothetical protein
MKLVGKLLLALVLVSPAAQADSLRIYGDGDPFPLSCVDFSGSWRTDAGENFAMSQHNCDRLRIVFSYGSEQNMVTIVPDNRTRPVEGGQGQVRHRWNSSNRGTIMETHRVFMDQGARITEVITFELAQRDLLLETTYTTVECPADSGQARHETHQRVFRRMKGQTESAKPGKHRK